MSGFPQPQPAKAIVAARPDLSQREIARRLGVSHEWVWRILNGWVPPSARIRRGFAELLQVPEAELFDLHRFNGVGR